MASSFVSGLGDDLAEPSREAASALGDVSDDGLGGARELVCAIGRPTRKSVHDVHRSVELRRREAATLSAHLHVAVAVAVKVHDHDPDHEPRLRPIRDVP